MQRGAFRVLRGCRSWPQRASQQRFFCMCPFRQWQVLSVRISYGVIDQRERDVERREHERKILDPIHVKDIYGLDRMVSLARLGTLINASATGLLVKVRREDLSPEFFQHHLTPEVIEGETVGMTIVEMDLDIDGRVIRAYYTDEGCEIAMDFRNNAPAYWREALVDLLPAEGEMDQTDPPEK